MVDKGELLQLFDQIFAKRGGLFKTSILDDDLKSKFEVYKKRAETYLESFRKHSSLIHPPPIIVFDFIYNTKLNAVATKARENLYLIGINSGTIIILNDLFLRMMSYPILLKTIGDPSVETTDYPTLEKYYFDATLLASNKDPNLDSYELAKPRDRVRQEYASHLIEIALDFLVAHELTHIANGHVDYKCTVFGVTMLDEQNVKFTSEDEILTIQTLEMDADSMAISKGLGNACRRFLKQQSVSEERKQFYSNFNEVVFNWTFAVSTLVRIMVESSTYKDADMNPKTHPHPRLRQTMLIATVDEYLKNYYPKEYESFPKEIYGEITVAVEETYKCITGNKIDKEEYLNAIEKGKEYIPKVLEKWKVIRNDLMKYSFVELVK